MRLWHEDLIGRLPAAQLLGQHRECCALRGNGWGRKHSVVDYVFLHSPYKLFLYHQLIMEEMIRRGYHVSKEWKDKNYRGRSCEPYADLLETEKTNPIYAEHDEAYLEECLLNLREKNIKIGGR
ncbi:MAG: TIGR02328 family protein [Peptostreptococcaceae bacterium]|nr:TIGR02328 family protein [Peptostreptococcaceae bacterium]